MLIVRVGWSRIVAGQFDSDSDSESGESSFVNILEETACKQCSLADVRIQILSWCSGVSTVAKTAMKTGPVAQWSELPTHNR